MKYLKYIFTPLKIVIVFLIMKGIPLYNLGDIAEALSFIYFIPALIFIALDFILTFLLKNKSKINFMIQIILLSIFFVYYQYEIRSTYITYNEPTYKDFIIVYDIEVGENLKWKPLFDKSIEINNENIIFVSDAILKEDRKKVINQYGRNVKQYLDYHRSIKIGETLYHYDYFDYDKNNNNAIWVINKEIPDFEVLENELVKKLKTISQ